MIACLSFSDVWYQIQLFCGAMLEPFFWPRANFFCGGNMELVLDLEIVRHCHQHSIGGNVWST